MLVTTTDAGSWYRLYLEFEYVSSDATSECINVTINGIPYNDAESQWEHTG